MKRNHYRTGNYKPDHSTCGGVIYNYDFEGYVSMADIAERIIFDLKFDEKCRETANNKQKGITNVKNRI